MTKFPDLRLARRLAVIALAFPLIGACGQKGPLYLPGDPSEIRTEVPKQEAPQEIPASEAQDEDDEDETPDDQP